MRHLSYFWRLRPENTMYQIPFQYEAQGYRGGETIPPAVGVYPTGALQGWDDDAWPQAGIPFSIFTSQYGSAGKAKRSPISYLVEPLDDWSRKQISQPPLVKAEQFVVLNNFGSSPGVLPYPMVQTSESAFYTLNFVIDIKNDPGIGRINSLTFSGQDIEVAYGYPLVSPDFSTAPPTETPIRGIFQAEFEPSTIPPLPAGNYANSLPALLINSLYYPSNPDNAQTTPPLGDPCCPTGDEWGFIGPYNYNGGVVGLYLIGYQSWGKGEGLVPEVPTGYTRIQVFMSVVNYGPQLEVPSLRVGYYDTYSEFGGTVEKFVDATVTLTGQPPDFIDGTSFGAFYPNNNNIMFMSDFPPNGFVNVVINDQKYYENPDGTASLGISGDAAPFPVQPGIGIPQYNLRPNIYVLPGQTFDVEYTVNTDMLAMGQWLREVGDKAYGGTPSNVENRIEYGWDFAQVFLDYWIFEGSEALICQKLLKLGIEIHPESVDWYKQMILNMEGLESNTYEKYLKLMKEWKKRQEAQDAAYHRKRGKRARIR